MEKLLTLATEIVTKFDLRALNDSDVLILIETLEAEILVKSENL